MSVTNVNLKPVSKSHLKFRKIPANSDLHTNHYEESLIHNSGDEFKVVLEFSDKAAMAMSSGYGLLVELSMRDLSSASRSGAVRTVYSGQFSNMPLGVWQSQDTPKYGSNLKFTTKGFRNLTGLAIPLSKVEPQSGTITVTVTPVQVVWQDGDLTSRYGPQGPLGVRRYMGYRPLDGDIGKAQVWSFRPVTKAAFDKAIGRCSLPVPPAFASGCSSFTNDADFEVQCRAIDQQFREMHEAWKLEQAQLQTRSDTDHIARSTQSNDVPQPCTVSPILPALEVGLQPSIEPPQRKDVEPQRTVIRASKRKRRDKPVVCTCPVEHHNAARRTMKHKSTEPNSGDGSLVAKPKPKLKRAIKDKETPESEPPEEPKETIAKACGQCHEIKRAPRGKKIAFRKAHGRFMYVPQSAPDDDEVEDEITNDASRQDEDEEEPQPQQSPKHTDVAEMSQGIPAVLGASELPASDESVVPQEPIGGTSTATNVSRGESAALPLINQALDTPAAGVDVVPQVISEEPETAMEGAAIEQTDTPPEHPELLMTGPDSGIRPEIVGEESETITAASPALSKEKLNTQQDPTQQSIEIEGDLPPMISTGCSESRKRSAEPVEERPSKQRRVDVDLTNEDDDMILVKTEMLEDRSKKPLMGRDEVSRKSELEALLEDNRLQQTEVRLKRQAAEMLRELKQLNEKSGSAAAERKANVKVEIEID